MGKLFNSADKKKKQFIRALEFNKQFINNMYMASLKIPNAFLDHVDINRINELCSIIEKSTLDASNSICELISLIK